MYPPLVFRLTKKLSLIRVKYFRAALASTPLAAYPCSTPFWFEEAFKEERDILGGKRKKMGKSEIMTSVRGTSPGVDVQNVQLSWIFSLAPQIR